ncbi:MAG: hypothetical protein LBJ48_02190, partial [Coriobacteriales bacterium]|nr:hypothetical protein [Coriobacteriales bacterium]
MLKRKLVSILLTTVLVFSTAPLAYAQEGASEGEASNAGEVISTAQESSEQTGENGGVSEAGDDLLPYEPIEADSAEADSTGVDTIQGITTGSDSVADGIIPEVPQEQIGPVESYNPDDIIVVFSDNQQLDVEVEVLTEELDGYAHLAVEQRGEGQLTPLSATSAEQIEVERLDSGGSTEATASVEVPA